MAGVDFAVVRRETAEAARRAFTAIRGNHPGEQFYVYALYSDDDAMSVCPAANTEEGYQRCLARYEESRPEIEASLQPQGIAWGDYLHYFRWGTSEWAYCFEQAQHFVTAQELINVADRYDTTTPGAFRKFKARVYQTMVLALKDLDAEGLFGTGKRRNSVTLLCSITDSRDAGWLTVESAQRLNPAAVFRAFHPQWLACQDQENKDILEDPTIRSGYREFKKLRWPIG